MGWTVSGLGATLPKRAVLSCLLGRSLNAFHGYTRPPDTPPSHCPFSRISREWIRANQTWSLPLRYMQFPYASGQGMGAVGGVASRRPHLGPTGSGTGRGLPPCADGPPTSYFPLQSAPGRAHSAGSWSLHISFMSSWFRQSKQLSLTLAKPGFVSFSVEAVNTDSWIPHIIGC